MHADQIRREAVVVIEGTDGDRIEKRYAADVAQAIAHTFNATARQSGVGATARVIDEEAN